MEGRGRGGGIARWTAGRDALARAQKAGGRPEGNTPVSKVLATIGKKRNPVRRVALFSVYIVQEVVSNTEKGVCTVIKSREEGSWPHGRGD